MSTPAMPHQRTGSVLVVDDEPDILTALEDLLEHRYRVIKAGSPSEALDVIAREPDIGVIISDQRMPGMTGDALLERARTLTDAEAILLTGYADLDAVIRAVNQGRIVGYVPKPWDAEILLSMVASAHDRHRLTRELATERSLLRGLLDHAGDAVSFKDADGRFVRLNAIKAQRLGASIAECLGHLEGDFVTPDQAGAIAEAEQAAVTAGQPVESSESVETDGGLRWFLVTRIPIFDSAGAVRHLVTIEREITQQKLLEGRLRQADKMQALGTLAGGVAHDFNNLLTAILGSLELAAKRVGDDARLERFVSNAMTAAQRGAGLTQRLLSFSRQRDLNPQATDANQVIADMGDLLARTLGGIVRIERDLEQGLWPATVDPDQLELAILNLCINARDAMPEGGRLTLTTRNVSVTEAMPELADGDYAVIGVADTGTGIPPEVLARVFEPFFTTKEVGKGTGLGLSMVYGLVQQSGGGVMIDSTPGEGTRVDIYLPRSVEPVRQPEEEARSEERAVARARILVVDDDPDVREITAAFLRDLGHDLIEAYDAANALRVLEKRSDIDLIVADFAMPGMTGLELALAVQTRWPNVPVLLVTGYADAADVPAGISVLNKPFQQDDLGASVGRLLRGRNSATAAEPVRSGGL